MKILILNYIYTPYQKGGAEVSTQLLAESLVKLGNEVHVCTTAQENKTEIINQVIVHRLKEHNIYWSFYNEGVPLYKKLIWHTIDIYNIFNVRDIVKMLEDVRPDVIHTNVISGFSSVVWKIAKKKNIPVVHTMRDYYLTCVKSTRFNKGRVCNKSCKLCKYYSLPKRYLSKYVDAVVGISKFILDFHLQNGYFDNAKKTSVIYNAVKDIEFTGNFERRSVIGFLGRVHPSKGVELLIEAFLQTNSSQYTLEIGGNGDPKYISFLKSKYQSEKVKFLGRVDAYSFLHSIELLVVPSLWHEPFGRVIVEANACGCPVLVSNRGGMPELVNGTNGEVFELEKKEDLRNKLQDFVDGRNVFFIDNTKLNIFNSDFIAKEYLEVYDFLINKNEDDC